MKSAAKTEKLFLDDLAVGDEFTSEEYTVDAPQIREFAQQFDPQPFHLDEDAARETFFEGLAASGWHTAAITMRLLVRSVPMAGGLIGAGGEITWPRPTRPGDVLRVVSKVVKISPSTSRPDRGIVTVQSDTLNQRGELCQRLVAKLLVFRRGSITART
ncbi:MAG: MaoC family dehydratase [Verrucomicrobia bacterium]|nr:MaoC family dehydratase [Verrucomicrobiota bacterium]